MATEISNGKQTVKLYRSVNRGKAMYQLAFYTAGRRIQKNFKDKSEAKRAAKQILGGLTQDAQAMTKLGKTSLREAVEFFLRHNRADVPRLTLAEIAEQFAKSRQQSGLSAHYVSQCGSARASLGRKMACVIRSIWRVMKRSTSVREPNGAR